MLTSKQTAFLKAIAHQEKAKFQIGKNGVTDALLDGISSYLKAHELVKIKVFEIEDGLTIKDLAIDIADKLKADLVSTLGKTIVLFRRNPQNVKIVLPKTTDKKNKSNN
ncbi:YhbY family RNA-binding protein [bacterium]|nr:YhbY family RNA-binding protein [bacterium]